MFGLSAYRLSTDDSVPGPLQNLRNPTSNVSQSFALVPVSRHWKKILGGSPVASRSQSHAKTAIATILGSEPTDSQKAQAGGPGLGPPSEAGDKTSSHLSLYPTVAVLSTQSELNLHHARLGNHSPAKHQLCESDYFSLRPSAFPWGRESRPSGGTWRPARGRALIPLTSPFSTSDHNAHQIFVAADSRQAWTGMVGRGSIRSLMALRGQP
ncbi:hypothetical protein Pst134EB_008270 [Puccinia striiformis f. sp. tritici]|nr:hypothetical protein Pst134EB_008270 [Puccinia striiformis f. sp. tritici]